MTALIPVLQTDGSYSDGVWPPGEGPSLASIPAKPDFIRKPGESVPVTHWPLPSSGSVLDVE